MRLPDFMKIFRSASKNRKTIAWSAGAALVGIVLGSVAKPVPITINFGLSYLARGLFGIDAGDWLQAFATIFGIFFTVWATRKLERESDERTKKREFASVIELKNYISMLVNSLSNFPPIDQQLSIVAARSTLTLLMNMKHQIEFAKTSTNINSISLLTSIDFLERGIHSIGDILTEFDYINEESSDLDKFNFQTRINQFIVIMNTGLSMMNDSLNQIIQGPNDD